MSPRVAFTATIAAALRVNATCTAQPSHLCNAIGRLQAPAHSKVMLPECKYRVSLTDSGELLTAAHPWWDPHRRKSDHEAAPIS